MMIKQSGHSNPYDELRERGFTPEQISEFVIKSLDREELVKIPGSNAFLIDPLQFDIVQLTDKYLLIQPKGE